MNEMRKNSIVKWNILEKKAQAYKGGNNNYSLSPEGNYAFFSMLKTNGWTNEAIS